MAQGIDTIKKDIQLIIDAVKQSEASFSDGFQYTDLFSFVGILSQIPDAIKSKDALVAQVKDLTQDEVAEVLAFVDSQFSIGNKKLEGNIKDGINVVFSLLTFIKGLKAAEVVAPVQA